MNTTAIKQRIPETTNNLQTTFDELVKSTFGSSNDLLGYDLFQSGPFWEKEAKYPPYDIINLGDDSYKIDIAVAGFDRNDIEVTVADGIVKINAEHAEKTTDEVPDYVRRGIAKRAFMQKFRLPTYGEVDECELTNGILSITIKKNVPEEKLPKKVKIK